MQNPNERQIGGDHYEAELQHWDVIEDFGIGYLEGCATKYISRAHRKGVELQDLEKSEHYVEKLISKAEGDGAPERYRTEINALPYRTPRGYVPVGVTEQFCQSNGITGHRRFCVFRLLGSWTKAHLEEVRVLLQAEISEVRARQGGAPAAGTKSEAQG